MSLDPTTPAEKIWEAMQEIAGLDSDGDPIFTELNEDDEEVPIGPPETVFRPDLTAEEKKEIFAEAFSSEYDSYAVAGEVLGAADGSEDPSILKDYFLDITESSSSEFGEKLANYWATVKLEKGEAQTLDEVIKVESDAATKQSEFAAAVESSITSDSSTPQYLDFLENVEDVAKTIAWTITEQDSSGSTVTYVSNIT